MISDTQLNLLETLKLSLFDVVPQYHSIINWDDVITEAKAQTVMGLISPVVPVYDEASDRDKAMFMRIMHEQDRLLKCFECEGIPCVILKGSAASVYYPKPYLRTMGDIDILVQQKYFNESLKLLEKNGYVFVPEGEQDEHIPDKIRELVYTKNGISIEIHRSFSSPGVDVDDILDNAIQRRVYCNLNGYNFPILPTPENGIVLIGHINQHLKNNVLGLRQIIDWEMYIHSIAGSKIIVKQLIHLLMKTDLLTLAAYVTRMCNKFLGLSDQIDFGVAVDDELTDELIEVVLADGNFGRKVNSDKTQEELKVINASYGIKRYGFIMYFTRVGLGTSEFCKKHPSHKFIAFFYGLFSQLSRGIRAWFNNIQIGKTMAEGNKLYKMHSKRFELYEKLGVRTGKD